MNIIYIHTHDTGRYIEPYGYNIPAPNLMKFAKESTLFRHAYCAGPTCSPSRAALLTGMAPHSCGMIGLAHRGFKLNHYSEHIVNFLNEAGFETALCGVQHEAKSDESIGYTHILHDSYKKYKNFKERDVSNAEKAAEYIKKIKDNPFFLSFGMINTHRVYPEIDEDINPDYVMPPAPIYDSKVNREDIAAFMTSVRTVDKCVGIVMDAVRESGIEEDTLMIFTTDHGIAFPWMKCNLYDTGIGVSFMIKYPENKTKGKAVDSLVSQIDVFPTICDLLGIETPASLQGKSMRPILEGRADKIRDEIFSEVTYHAAYEPMRCIRTDRYKLIRYYDNHDNYVPANIDDGPSKTFLVEAGLLKRSRIKEQLFDLYLDPYERVNLADDSQYKDIYIGLVSRLEGWMEETDDPVLKGKVEKPEGAIANHISCLSPNIEDFE